MAARLSHNSSQRLSLSQSQGSTQALTQDELKRKACDVVNLFLVWQQRNIPLKRADIVKYVVKDNKSYYSELFAMAEKNLKNVFGFKVQEICEGPRKGYILLNILEKAEPQPLIDYGNPKRGVLTFILSVIFMAGDRVSEGNLWERMKDVGLHKDHEHPAFGDVKKLFSEFVRQQYIFMDKIPNQKPPQIEYRWGPRAHCEVAKRDILQFVTTLHGFDSIQVWKSQYQDILDEENQQSSQITTTTTTRRSGV